MLALVMGTVPAEAAVYILHANSAGTADAVQLPDPAPAPAPAGCSAGRLGFFVVVTEGSSSGKQTIKKTP
jgi:hypothetical protein